MRTEKCFNCSGGAGGTGVPPVVDGGFRENNSALWQILSSSREEVKVEGMGRVKREYTAPSFGKAKK